MFSTSVAILCRFPVCLFNSHILICKEDVMFLATNDHGLFNYVLPELLDCFMFFLSPVNIASLRNCVTFEALHLDR